MFFQLSYFLQVLATFCATLGCYLNGTVLGYTAPAIPSLMDAKNGQDLYGNSFSITSQQASWVTGILSLGCFFGCILAGPIMEKIGRKKALLYLTSLWFFLGYLLIFLANHIAFIYLGRYVHCTVFVMSMQVLNRHKNRFIVLQLFRLFLHLHTLQLILNWGKQG